MKTSISRSVAMRSASCVALVTAGLWSCAAFAQAAPADTPTPADTQASAQGDTAEQSGVPTGLGDIIVTARRQSENLQRVPVTVTALSGDQLQRQNVVAPSDLQFAAPSVTVQAELGRLGGSYTVRGVNAGTVTYFAEAPGGPTAIGMPFFDEASVQILNGPQGTLFGRTAAAGAVLITPKRPDLSKTGGSIDIDVGNYGRLMGTGVLNVPIIQDELAIRVVYHHEHVDGFTKQFAPSQIISGLPGQIDTSKNLDEVNNDSIRVSAEWHRGDFKNYAVFSYLNVNQTGPGQILSYANPNLANLNRNAAFFAGQAYCTSTADPTGCGNQRAAAMAQLKSLIQTELARSQGGGSVRETPALQGMGTFDRARHKSVIDIAEYDFGDLGFTTLHAKNVFSYQQDWGVSSYALDGVGGTALAVVSSTGRPLVQTPHNQQYGNAIVSDLGKPVRTITEEFQLQGKAAGMIDWTGGFYYQQFKQPTDLTGEYSFARSYSGLFAVGQRWAANYPLVNGSTITEKAGYGQVTIDLDKVGVHGLSLTGGYRKTWNTTKTRGFVAVQDPVTGNVVPGAALTVPDTKFTGANYTLGINEQITRDLMVYFTHSKSFVPGGRNTTVGCNIAPGCNDVYNPATAKNYELGVKSQFRLGEAALRVNATAYRLDFTDIQQNSRFTSGATNILYTINAANARIQGLEITTDLAWRQLNLSLGYSYNDAKFTNWLAPDPNNQTLPGEGFLKDLSGNPFQNAPKNQFRATARYDFIDDADTGTAFLQLNGYYQTRQWHVVAPKRELQVAQFYGLGDVTDYISQKPYGTLGVRVGWDNILGSNFSGAVFVNNLTNTTYSQAGSSRSYSTGTTVRLYAPPRMWGLNLRYKFGD